MQKHIQPGGAGLDLWCNIVGRFGSSLEVVDGFYQHENNKRDDQEIDARSEKSAIGKNRSTRFAGSVKADTRRC